VRDGASTSRQDPKQRQFELESNLLLVTEVHCKHWPLPLASLGEQDHGGNAGTPQEKRRKTNSHHRNDSHPDRQTPEQSDCSKHTCRIVGTRQPKVPLHDACKGHQPEQARSGYPFVSSIGSWLHCPGTQHAWHPGLRTGSCAVGYVSGNFHLRNRICGTGRCSKQFLGDHISGN